MQELFNFALGKAADRGGKEGPVAGGEAEERRDGSGRDGGSRLPLGQGFRACLRLRDPADGAGDEQRRGAQRTKHRTDPSSQLEILEAGS